MIYGSEALPIMLSYSALGRAGSSDDRLSPFNVIAAISDSGAIRVIIDVILLVSELGKLWFRGSK